MFEGNSELKKVIAYMQSHWPSQVKPEWQVSLNEYPEILMKVLADFTVGKTRNRNLVRIAGLSGSGKTTQLLPAVEAYFKKNHENPVLVAARRFAPYHPHYQEISDFYGEENVRKLTDEFSTIMLFLSLSELIKNGFDIILDVTLLDPEIEKILIKLLTHANYEHFIVMIAASPEITEKHLSSRSWRHSRETELEFIRATTLALKFYAENAGETKIILWNTYDKNPIYNGPVKNSLATFERESKITEVPGHDEDKLKQAKIKFLSET
ncbi:MAG: zeta toxin family protein [Candidatus Saccharibacteria bacterium]|nr:zeta toxin family protein [Candidatus Saccharibacteria bacterium]